jgi:hypothetical protein
MGTPKMKTSVIPLAIAMLASPIAACGGTSGTPALVAHSSSNNVTASGTAARAGQSARPSGGYLRSDGDLDPDDQGKAPNDDEWEMAAAGHGASGAEQRAITSIVRNYYAVATAGDGAKGCSLLDHALAQATAQGAGNAATGGASTCAASLSLLFKQQHQYLAAEDAATMVVTGVHVKGSVGVVTLGFKTMPEAELLLHRDGRAWRINALFDHQLP